MANAFATNYTIPLSTNAMPFLWNLSRVMKKAGWTVTASSDGYTQDNTGVQSADKWGGNADPAADTYPPNSMSDYNYAWIVMRGPSTIKMPLSAAPSGTLIRGETITQATSAAEGELLGYVWDTVGLTGYAVILPRTGTFDNTHTVTGSTSSATFIPTGTVIVYGREIMFSKAGGNTASIGGYLGQIFYICADLSADASQFFSAIAGTLTLASSTTVAVGGATLSASFTLNVTSTAGYPTSGAVLVTTVANGNQIVTYTSVASATSFGGCNAATASTANSGAAVVALPTTPPGGLGTTIAAASNGFTLPQGTINVASTQGFPATGTLHIHVTGNSVTNPQIITYTGITATTFTGCTGGNAVLLTGQPITNFPTKAICVRGDIYGVITASTLPFGYAAMFNNLSTFSASNNGQAGCANAIASSGVSADGSFYALVSGIANSALSTGCIAFTRLDDTEPGDVDPYAWLSHKSGTLVTWNNWFTALSDGSHNSLSSATILLDTTYGGFIGYASRGGPVAANDIPTQWLGTISQTSTNFTTSWGGATALRILNHPAASPPILREPILLYNNGTQMGGFKQIKGRTRWIQVTNVGNIYDTFDNKTWIAGTSFVTGSPGTPTIIFGPYDGTTTPIL